MNVGKSARICRMAVRAQVEFYFGDANLAKDRFLGTKIAESSDGCLRRREFLAVCNVFSK